MSTVAVVGFGLALHCRGSVQRAATRLQISQGWEKKLVFSRGTESKRPLPPPTFTSLPLFRFVAEAKRAITKLLITGVK